MYRSIKVISSNLINMTCAQVKMTFASFKKGRRKDGQRTILKQLLMG